jgi:phosphoglycerate-specific signal transduction histidine kinase
MAETMQKVDGLSIMMNKVYQCVSSLLTKNNATAASGRENIRDSSTQVDLISVIGNNCCGFESYCSEFSTDIEGVKLNTVIMESKLSTEIHSNTQAIIGIHSELEKIQNNHRICVKQSNYHPQNTAKSLDGNQTCTVNRLVKDNHQLVENINNLTTELATCKNRLNNIESGINYDSTHHCAILTTIKHIMKQIM